MNTTLKNLQRNASILALAVGITLTTLAPTQAHAHRNDGLSGISALSMLPIASVAIAGAGASVGAVAIPVALSTSGALLVVKSVEVSARGMICVLERASDGAIASIELAGRVAERGSLVVGRSVEVSVVGAGVVLSAMGEVIAFVPNELGRALLHNERITY